MSSWSVLFKKPETLRDRAAVEGWFTRIASRLLNGCRVMIDGEPHRFTEAEFYYFGEEHPDAFTHRDPIQQECGRWYFHRTGGAYRSGSFKGFDLTFGEGGAFGGVLIRGFETPDGTLIDGPSLCVDYLLKKTGSREVAALDQAIGGRVAWDNTNPLFLSETADGEPRQLFRSARVGLTLKRSRPSSDAPGYVMRPYRYLTEPRRISKGKLLLVLALHAQGTAPEAIRAITGCPRVTVQRYIADFEEGRREADFAPYFGAELKPKDLCKMYGTWQAVHGNAAAP